MANETENPEVQTGAAQPEESQGVLQSVFNLYWQYVRPYLWLYFASVAIFLLGAFLYLYTSTPLYRSTCRVHISQNQLNVVQVQGLNDPTYSANTFLNTQVILLGSEDIVTQGYDELSLTPDQRALLQWPTISEVKGTNLVDLSVVSADRELAAKAANGIVKAYINSQHSRRSVISNSGLALLQGHLERVTNEHKAAVQELLDFKQEKKIYDFDASYKSLTDRLASLQDAILVDEGKQSELELLQKEIQEDPDGAITMLPYLLLSHEGTESGVSSASIIAEKLSHLQELGLTHRMNLPEYVAKYGAGSANQAMQIYKEAGELIQKTEQAEIETGIRGLGLSIVQLGKHKANLEKRSAEISEEVAKMDQLRGEYHRREAAIAALEKTMDMLSSRIYEIQITDSPEDTNDFSVFVISPAVAASAPFFPVRVKVLAIGIFLGIALAVFVSFVLVSLSTKLTSLEMVCGFFGKRIPNFGNVPSVLVDGKAEESLDEKERLARRESRRSTVDEAFRDIRTALNLSLVMRSSKLLAVCSAVSGEGKTFVACNLARSFAQEQKRVLLVDCDLRKPDIHHQFQEYLPEDARKKGVSNVLVGDCKLMDVVHHIEKLGLDIATTGPIPPNPNELLSMGHLSEMLEDAKANYDLVVVDTSPIMLVSDALLIAHQNVPFLLVARLFATNRNVIRQLATQLRQTGIFPAGLIANCADLPKNSYGYGGYGDYGKYGGYGAYGGYHYGRKPEMPDRKSKS